MNEIAKTVERRHGVLAEEKEVYKSGMIEIAKYFAPWIGPRLESIDTVPGASIAEDIYDSTSLSAVSVCVNGIIGHTMSKASPWMYFGLTDKEAMKDLEIRKWLQHATYHMYCVFNNSNFYNVLPAYVEQGLTVGPGIMYAEKDVPNNRVIFSSRSIGECFTATNMYGENDTMNRLFKVSLRNIVQRFGMDVLPEPMRLLAEDPEKQYDKVNVLHSVFPTSDGNWTSLGKKFSSIYMLEGEDDILGEKGYEEFPYSVWNWHLMPNESYPRTPAHIALPDVKGLNSMAKSMLKAGQMMVDPPIDVPIEMKGKVNNRPHGVNYYQDSSRIIKRGSGPNQIPYAEGMYAQKKSVVEDHFYVDFFKMLNSLTQRMTTVEVMERQSEKVALIGVPIGKFLTEGPDRMIERVFQMEVAEGRIPPPPTSLEGMDMDIIHTGPLAMLQQRLAKGQQVSRAFQELGPLFEAFPGAGNQVKPGELVKYLMEAYDFPVEAIKTDRELQAEQAAAQEEKSRQDNLQQTEVMGKAMPGFAKAQEMKAANV